MRYWEYSVLMCFTWIVTIQADIMTLDQLSFFINQNRYTTNPVTFQTTFSLDNIMGTSLDRALEQCQRSFMWERWNCPSTDFFYRRTSKPYRINREDAYVAAISSAAIIYTITKHCSTGVATDCGCENAISTTSTLCADNPEKAAELYMKYLKKKFSSDFRGLIEQQNYKAITTLMSQSLIRQCGCAANANAACSEESCINVLRPFAEIADEIKLMYDEGLELSDGINTQVMWSNIPLDALVYAMDSPNYCELDAVPLWPGMYGRRCLEAADNGNDEASSSCDTLCRECGYRVRAQNIVTEHNCDCKFTWHFQVHCERCMNVEQQYYCY